VPGLQGSEIELAPLALQAPNNDRPPQSIEKADDDQTDLARRPWCCRACAHPIASDAARAEIDGRHVHMRLNPAGVAFVFGAFSTAPGCAVVGAPTDEATWFAGCRWSFALCGQCGAHLGWSFSGAQQFFGLVLEKLVEPATDA
jgi:hypothetical protein